MPHVGTEDDFFSLGGHSLLAIRVAGRLNTGHGYDIAFRDIFEQRTISRLAGLIAARQARCRAAE